VQDRRRIRRTRVLKGATIILHDCSSVVDCTVLNITNFGVCLEVPYSAGIPNVFDLSFDRARTRRQCCAIWRSDNRLGVSFG
jgi:hypothetical protein